MGQALCLLNRLVYDSIDVIQSHESTQCLIQCLVFARLLNDLWIVWPFDHLLWHSLNTRTTNTKTINHWLSHLIHSSGVETIYKAKEKFDYILDAINKLEKLFTHWYLGTDCGQQLKNRLISMKKFFGYNRQTICHSLSRILFVKSEEVNRRNDELIAEPTT